jgi:hypothetical protein
MALGRPETVRRLILLESSLLSVPSGDALFHQPGPAFETYGRGDRMRIDDVTVSPHAKPT